MNMYRFKWNVSAFNFCHCNYSHIVFQICLLFTIFLIIFPSKYVICLIKYFRVEFTLVLREFSGRISETWVRAAIAWVRQNWKTRGLTRCAHRNSIDMCWLPYLWHVVLSVAHWNDSCFALTSAWRENSKLIILGSPWSMSFCASGL